MNPVIPKCVWRGSRTAALTAVGSEPHCLLRTLPQPLTSRDPLGGLFFASPGFSCLHCEMEPVSWRSPDRVVVRVK